MSCSPLGLHHKFQVCKGCTVRPYLRKGKEGILVLIMYTCLALCGCVHMSAGTHGVQKKASDALEQELQLVLGRLMWMLANELRSFVREANALSSRTVSLRKWFYRKLKL